MSYKNLEIWHESRMLVVDIHKMTLEKLPKFEMDEGGGGQRRYWFLAAGYWYLVAG